jgi:hypothetical protein
VAEKKANEARVGKNTLSRKDPKPVMDFILSHQA